VRQHPTAAAGGTAILGAASDPADAVAIAARTAAARFLGNDQPRPPTVPPKSPTVLDDHTPADP
jgi:hypothetical protein